MVLPFGVAILFLAVLGPSSALGRMPVPPRPGVPKIHAPTSLPLRSSNGSTEALAPYDTVYYFDQLIDHNNASLGTFKQRYCFTYEFYEKGGPIIMTTPGESSMDGSSGYLTNLTINGQIARATNGATVVLEHRCFGGSSPYPDLKESTLRYLSVEQAIEDFVYFANNVHLPMPGGDQVPTTKAPWILIGGSYAGALVSWTMTAKPGVFWAGYAFSAVVQATDYYWAYFEPIRQYMPQNCSADVQKVINYVDATFTNGTSTQIQALKQTLGMGAVSHVDDVAGALRNPIWTWQNLQPGDTDQSFFRFCDALEVRNGVSAGSGGWGLDHALTAYGNYMKEYVHSNCQSMTQEACLGSCNEFGFSQVGAPTNWPTIVSRLVGPQYDMRQCPYWFPESFPQPRLPDTADINTKYSGWDVDQTRLFFANGMRDPWRDVTVSSDFHNRQSTDLQPISVSNGFHCSDLLTRFGAADRTIYNVQQLGVAYFTKWVKDWQVKNPGAVKGGKVSVIDPAIVSTPPAFQPKVSPPVDASPIRVVVNLTAATSPIEPINKDAKKIIPSSFNFGSKL